MSEILKRDLGILGVIFGICLFILYKIIKFARDEAEIEQKFETESQNFEYPEIIFECPIRVKVLSSIDELKSIPGNCAVAYAEVLDRQFKTSKNIVCNLNQDECSENFKSDDSPMTPPPHYDALSSSLNYHEIMENKKLLLE